MTTDADKIDNLLAQRRELMDKIEEQIDERGRIIERIQSAPDTPIARLRATHIEERDDLGPYCARDATTYPCDTVAALDALDALLVVSPADLEAFALSTQSIIRHAEGKDTEIRALQARLDAATALIWGAQMDEHMNHGASLKRAALRACEHPNCAPYRAWLAGDKEEHSEL